MFVVDIFQNKAEGIPHHENVSCLFPSSHFVFFFSNLQTLDSPNEQIHMYYSNIFRVGKAFYCVNTTSTPAFSST